MSEIFEIAARTKLRFDSNVGELTVEDLFDLPLTHPTKTSLDSIAMALHKKLNESSVVSFVNELTPANSVTQLKFDIVMHILNLKKTEKTAREEAAARKVKKEQILQLIAQKENEKLAGMDLAELKKMAEDL